jgi:type I restriction enzyme S subunit
MITDLKPYPEYKDSGVPWLGKVPEHWEVLPNRAIFLEVNERNHPDEPLLSVTIGKGVIRQTDLLANTSKKDSSNENKVNYKLVQPNDITYNKMRAWQGAVGVSKYRGIVSPAYVVVRLRSDQNPSYFHHLYRTPMFAKEAERWSYGITSDMWSLRPEHFKMIYTVLPPLPEQSAIVRFIDHFERCINRLIRAKRQLIELLNEQKQAVIHRAVTRGLDPNVRLKPSGVEWLGDVPEHWEVGRLRNFVKLIVSNVDKHTIEGEVPIRLCNYVDVYKKDTITEQISFMRATATKDEVNQFRLRVGDVVITKDSEMWNDIGVPALVAYEAPDLVCGYHLAILRPDPRQMHGEFLLRCFQDRLLVTQLHIQANGITRYGLSQHAIKDCLVPVPPVKDQVYICAMLQRDLAGINTAEVKARHEIDLLHEYRTRLIADVVTGKLDVRGVEMPSLDEGEAVENLEIGGDAETDEMTDIEEITNGDE